MSMLATKLQLSRNAIVEMTHLVGGGVHIKLHMNANIVIDPVKYGRHSIG